MSIDPPTDTAPRQLLAAERSARAARLAIRALEAASPAAAARLAEALFCKTLRPKPRPDEAAFLATARRFSIPALGLRIAGYRWGPSGAPRVLLTHGWWSHAGRFVLLAGALESRGLEVIAFDAPGHGRSTGWRASMPEFAWTLRAVAESIGPLHAAVGHSLGGAATIFAQSRGLDAGRLVTLAAPADLAAWAERFRTLLDLDDEVYRRMRRNLERRLSLGWAELDIPAAASRLAVPGLVIHDTEDGDVPVAEGQLIADRWPGATLHATSGLGHRQVLRDADVIARAVAFITAT